ncbi:MAG: hypothetical protein AB8B72_03950 [Crocinitomicaceae bacterium]
MDVSVNNPIPELLVDDLEWPLGLSFANATDLYFAQYDVNRISKVSFRTLTTTEIDSKPKLSVFPNPSFNFIQISGP